MRVGLTSLGFGLVALAAFTWVPGFLGFDMAAAAAATALMAVGAGLATFGKRRAGLTLASACAAVWLLLFLLAGFSFLDTAAAFLLTVGFGAAAAANGPGGVLAGGMATAGAGNLWYLVNNTFLDGTPAFALGNWAFLVGTALVVAAALGRADTPDAGGSPA